MPEITPLIVCDPEAASILVGAFSVTGESIAFEPVPKRIFPPPEITGFAIATPPDNAKVAPEATITVNDAPGAPEPNESLLVTVKVPALISVPPL